MRRASYLMVMIFAWSLSMLFARTVNDYYYSKIGPLKNDIPKFHLIIQNEYLYDRGELVDGLMDSADRFEVLIESVYMSVEGNKYYLYGSERYRNQSFMAQLITTGENGADLKDRNYQLDNLQIRNYGKIYTIADFPLAFDVQFLGFNYLKEDPIALNWAIRVIGEPEEVKAFVEHYAVAFNELDIEYQQLDPQILTPEFDWIGGFLKIGSLFWLVSLLMTFLSISTIMVNENRKINILKMQGYGAHRIGVYCFGSTIRNIIISFLIGLTGFDLLLVRVFDPYNSVFYQLQAFSFMLFVLSVLAVFEYFVYQLHRSSVSESVKQRHQASLSEQGRFIIKFILIITVLNLSLSEIKNFNNTLRFNFELNKRQDWLSSISYISGFNSQSIGFQESMSFNQKVLAQPLAQERYCLWQSTNKEVGVLYPNQLSVNIGILNQNTARFLFDDISLEDKQVLVSNNLKDYSRFNRSLIGGLNYLEYPIQMKSKLILNLNPVTLTPNESSAFIMIVDNAYFETSVMAPHCFFQEETMGSIEKVESLFSTEERRMVYLRSHQSQFKRTLIRSNQSLNESIIQLGLTLFSIMLYFIYLFVQYLRDHRFKLALKAMHGYPDVLIIGDFALLNSLVSLSSIIYFIIMKRLSVQLLAVIIALYLFECIGLWIVMRLERKEIKTWIK